ncbi:hypothetical protein AB0B25_27345 [Nocardia sp. NPDC049190]|uniref:hypothetical protein n=1 Tax=Nocardia sp. NPDC049190 TaxID=3155650 RepID=UPI0033C82C2A
MDGSPVGHWQPAARLTVLLDEDDKWQHAAVDEHDRPGASVEQNAEPFTSINVTLEPIELWQGAAR